MDGKQYGIDHQSAERPDLNREEIRGGHHVPMGFQERHLRGALLALWRRFYAMPFQDILDRIRCNDVTEIGECALDPIVAPGHVTRVEGAMLPAVFAAYQG